MSLPIVPTIAATFLLTVAFASSVTADEDVAKKKLEAKGIRVSSSGLTLPDEANLSKGLRDIAKVRKGMIDADSELNAIERKRLENKQAIMLLTQQNFQLNTRLANAADVETNNRLVGSINANVAQIRLLQEAGNQIAEQLKAARAKAGHAREKYIQSILDLRRKADAISKQYKTLADDSEVKNALAQLNEAQSESHELTESRSFRSSLRELARLEETVLSESIPLRREGRTLYVSVVLEGKHTQDMVLDVGASLISLSRDVASRCGIEVKPTDPTIELELADGSTIRGHLVTIRSVRVGKFTAENVECAVLGPEAAGAPPLLGMSFLEKFTFEVNADKGTLTMQMIEGSGQSSGKTTARPKSKK